MTAADGDDTDRPAGDDTNPETDSHGSGMTDGGEEPDDEGTSDGGDSSMGGEKEADGGEAEDDEGADDGEKSADDGGAEDGGVPDDGGMTGEGAATEVDLPDVDESGFKGAPDDEEMPLTEHIEEMLRRMVAVIVVMAGVSLLVFPIADTVINFLWYSFLPAPEGGISQCGAVGENEVSACPRVYRPLALLIARLKVASLAGLIVALPVFVYQTYLFMRPGLYPNERRYYLAAVPTSLVLALVGVAFAYFLVLPLIFRYFLFYSEDVADIAFGLTETFDLILLMMGLFALIFQIPLFIMLAIMMGVTTRAWLEERRLLFWFAFGGVAFLFSPDPTGMAPIIVALTMIVLFEFTLALLRWTGR